ncbi:hypothetical protein L9F63_020469, partial [Diploptera punctata]
TNIRRAKVNSNALTYRTHEQLCLRSLNNKCLVFFKLSNSACEKKVGILYENICKQVLQQCNIKYSEYSSLHSEFYMLEVTNNATITQFYDNVLLLITDSASYMIKSAIRSLEAVVTGNKTYVTETKLMCLTMSAKKTMGQRETPSG